MKEIVLDLKYGEGGIGYRIDPETKTYRAGPLKDGVLVDASTGEYVDAQKFANQLYYVILASLNEETAPKK